MNNCDKVFIASLKKDIENIGDNVSDLLWDKKMYEDFGTIIKNNPKIDKPNLFYDFIKIGYISHVVLGICRQIDKDEHSLSLVNFLNKVFDNCEKIRKDWFVKQYEKSGLDKIFGRSGYGKHIAERDFKKHFGELDFIDPSMVCADIGSLIFYSKEIKKYRNKRIAHFDKDKKGKVVFNLDFKTLNKSIKVIEELTKKYYLLLHQSWFQTLLPVDNTENYKKIFHTPWIEIKGQNER